MARQHTFFLCPPSSRSRSLTASIRPAPRLRPEPRDVERDGLPGRDRQRCRRAERHRHRHGLRRHEPLRTGLRRRQAHRSAVLHDLSRPSLEAIADNAGSTAAVTHAMPSVAAGEQESGGTPVRGQTQRRRRSGYSSTTSSRRRLGRRSPTPRLDVRMNSTSSDFLDLSDGSRRSVRSRGWYSSAGGSGRRGAAWRRRLVRNPGAPGRWCSGRTCAHGCRRSWRTAGRPW